MPPVTPADVARYADVLAAMGAEPRLRIVRLLLAAHPSGLIAGDIGGELDIAPSTLSHHLDRLKREGVVHVRREGTFLWYMANAGRSRICCSFCSRSAVREPARSVPRGSSPRPPAPPRRGSDSDA